MDSLCDAGALSAIEARFFCDDRKAEELFYQHRYPEKVNNLDYHKKGQKKLEEPSGKLEDRVNRTGEKGKGSNRTTMRFWDTPTKNGLMKNVSIPNIIISKMIRRLNMLGNA